MKTQQNNISEVKLINRTKVKASERPQVKCSKDAFDIFMESRDLDSIEHIEEFKLILLTRSAFRRSSNTWDRRSFNEKLF